jgi:hypothetical protein
MEKISSEVLQKWTKGENFDNAPFFVVVKTQGCGKCEALLKKENIFRNKDWFNSYTFSPQDKIGLSILQEIGITSVPFILFRYKINHGKFYKYQTGYILPDVDDGFMNLENIFDAIYDNDSKFFGFNELDEMIEKDAKDNYTMIRLLHEIFGELSEETISERNSFKDSVTN